MGIAQNQHLKAGDMTLEEFQKQLDALDSKGITVSICYGTTAANYKFSVDCLNRVDQRTFQRPFAAHSLEHCIEVANIHCQALGWIEIKHLEDMEE